MGLLPIFRDFSRLDALLQDHSSEESHVSEVVADILRQVRSGRDDALLRLTAKYDGVTITSIDASAEQIALAEAQLPSSLRESILQAGLNLRRFHQLQLPQPYDLEQPDGTLTNWRWRPIKRIGIYVPGGRSPLASSLLMAAIPAQIAGVAEVVVCTPPQADGRADPSILGLCSLLGIRQVYGIGGAQAIGALAYGSETIKPVHKIVGPGNVYVAEAKAQVSRHVGVDLAAGPTEIVILADDTANAGWVAADLISQAEHDPEATATLFTTDAALAEKVNQHLEMMLPTLATEETSRTSLESRGAIYVGADLGDCLKMINHIAPEHLSLQIRAARHFAKRCIAGAIFIGHSTPVAWGDYWAGPNHTLPTAGQARFRGPLSVLDFLVPYSMIEAPMKAIAASGNTVIELARAEGMAGHALSMSVRMDHE